MRDSSTAGLIVRTIMAEAAAVTLIARLAKTDPQICDDVIKEIQVQADEMKAVLTAAAGKYPTSAGNIAKILNDIPKHLDEVKQEIEALKQ